MSDDIKKEFDAARNEFKNNGGVFTAKVLGMMLRACASLAGQEVKDISENTVVQDEAPEAIRPLDILSGLVYALEHAEEDTSNPNKPFYISGSNCANFVSQILLAAGMEMWDVDKKISGWYFSDFTNSDTSANAWSGTSSLYYSFIGRSDGKYHDYPTSSYLLSNTTIGKDSASQHGYKVFDLIFIQYSNEPNRTPGHVGIVIGFTDNGDPIIAQQGSDHRITTLSEMLGRYPTNTRDITEVNVVSLIAK